jgi:hypothetical protein
VIILFVASTITACGATLPAAPPSSAPQSTLASETPTASSTPSTPGADETPVPITRQSLTLNGVEWTLEQPQGVPVQASANAHGVLWVQFPAMLTNRQIEQYGMAPIPRGPYQVWYTPLRPDGGDLAQAAEPILTLPSAAGTDDLRMVSVVAAGADHFLLRTYELAHNAQTGGTTRIHWIDPRAGSTKEVVAAPEGGGKFLTTAQNETWLFWNRYEIGDAGSYAPDAQAGLVALRDGSNHSISLGEPNVAHRAEWASDGKLHFSRGQEPVHLVFDPATNSVEPQL